MLKSSNGFKREQKEDRPVVAICYDFDKTLSPDDMQAQGYIQDTYGEEIDKFWEETDNLGKENDMDQNLAYMYLMKDVAGGKIVFTKKVLREYGAKVKLYPGVETWFDRINAIGEAAGVIVEHYIISSGLKEMIEATLPGVNGAFKKVYASSFYYNKKGEAVWPAQVINYTNKTQFLFRIEKGTLDINDPGVNDYFRPDELRVPFDHMVYIGDSATDVPCMKLVNSNGGHSIGVYDPEKQDKSKVFTMTQENRIQYFAKADYSEGSDLEKLLCKIIGWVAKQDELHEAHFECVREVMEANNGQSISPEEQQRINLISALSNSRSYRSTHTIIEKLAQITTWSDKEKDELITAALVNHQISGILNDSDIKSFYESLLMETNSEKANKLREKLLTELW